MSRLGINTNNKPPLKLDPDAIRRRASSVVGCMEASSSLLAINKSSSHSNKNASNTASSTVTFLVGMKGNNTNSNNNSASNNSDNNLALITIYCDTGTIATGRVLHGIVRHHFRRNVTTLDVVERCLKYPSPIAPIDWQLVSMTDGPTITNPNDSSNNNECLPREKSIKNNLELCDVGLAILKGEREKLLEHKNSIFQQQQYQQPVTPTSTDTSVTTRTPTSISHQSLNSNSNNNSNNRKQPPTSHSSTASSCSNSYNNNNNNNNMGVGPAPTSGMEFQFSLADRPMKHVDQCLTDIQKMNKIVHAVSTNGVGTVFLYGNGGVAYTPNIPRTLYQKLSQLRYSKIHSYRPQYVALGSRERYFVAFHDGTVSYKGPKGLDKELRKLTPNATSSTTSSGSANNSNNNNKPLWPLRSVAFGSSYDTFCIVFQDGTYKYQGKSFPKELEKLLKNPTLHFHNNYKKSIVKKKDTDGDDDDSSSSNSSGIADDDDKNNSSYDSDEELNEILSSSLKEKKKQEKKNNDKKKGQSAMLTTSSISNDNITVSCINLGPSGEWFLRLEDGQMEWGGISEEMDEAVQQLLHDGHRLNYFDFGEDSSYFVSYD